METETEDGGIPPSPVIYSVTKVDDNLNPLEKSITVNGDIESKATLNDVKAGKYLVEQQEVPSGYIKDTRQVVTVSRTEDGEALFIISKPTVEEFEETEIKITKEILNKEGNTASNEDFRKAKLPEDTAHSFEVKITNTQTQEVYYTFIDEQNVKTIVGLPYGTYEIEEVYKPKYYLYEMTGNFLNKDDTTGKYTFTLNEDVEKEKNKIQIYIKNIINTDFGFGGQDFKDNLSRELYDSEPTNTVTKVRIYVRDDKGNKISNAKFKLFDSNGNIVKLTGVNGTYVPSTNGSEQIVPINGKIEIKSLDIGKYKLKNTETSEEYLKSIDRNVTVYKNAVGITRIELLRNIPRGSLKLSTIYKDENDTNHFVPNSKYKIIDVETNDVLTFIKKIDGTYERSNLPSASEYITLKAGDVEVTGIEAGKEYEIGIVYLTDEYGVTQEPKTINVNKDELQKVETEVEIRNVKFIKTLTIGNNNGYVWALDSDGEIWYGTDYYRYGNGNVADYRIKKQNYKTKFIDIVAMGDKIIGLDKDGKVYIDLAEESLNDKENSPIKNIKIKKMASDGTKEDDTFLYLIDENGTVWAYGDKIRKNNGTPWFTENGDVININDSYDLNGIIFTDIATHTSGGQTIAIDNKGKLWAWGTNATACGIPNAGVAYLEPTCISELENSSIKDKKIKKVVCGQEANFLIDTNNDLWSFGYYEHLGTEIDSGRYWNPICITQQTGNPLEDKKIIDVACAWSSVSAIDSDGKLWTWGREQSNGLLGYGEAKNNVSLPVRISSLDNNKLENTALVYVSAAYKNVASAIDEDGNIWLWGDRGPFGENINSKVIAPTRYKFSLKAYYEIPKFVKVAAGTNHSVAIDTDGRIWSWGSNANYALGVGKPSTELEKSQKPLCVGGYSSEISQHKFIDIAAGDSYTLAIDENEDLWCWGQGGSGQLGICISDKLINPTCITKLDPKESLVKIKDDINILYGKKIKKIDASGSTSVIIDSDGKLYTCGNNSYGELGNGTTSSGVYCVNDENDGELADVKFVDAKVGTYTIIALDANGYIWTAGNNQYGNLGHSENNGTTNGIKTFKCISEEVGNNLYHKKIKKIASRSLSFNYNR